MSINISILGSGWLGLPLAQQLQRAGHNVKVATRSDARLHQLASDGLSAFQIDIDAASGDISGFLQSNILIINIPNKNVESFQWLAQQISLSPINKILFISSTSVYKPWPTPVSEDCGALDPNHPLVQIEQLLSGLENIEATVIRFAGLIGPKRNPANFFKNGKSVADSDSPVNLIHLQDCIGIIEAIIAQQAWGDVFNGCATSHPSKREFYSAARQALGKELPNFADSANSAIKSVANNKLKQKLGYEFIHDDLMQLDFEHDF